MPKKIIRFLLDGVMTTLFLAAMAWAFLEGQERELHRMQVACESQRDQGFPVWDCGNNTVASK